MSLGLIPWAAKQQFGNALAKVVFMHLLIFNGRKGIIPSLARLAERTEFKERALRNAIRWLEQEGWISTIATSGKANSYEILRGPSDGELHEALADTPAFNAGVTPAGEPPPRHQMPETPALNAAESLKESPIQESPPMRAPAREGERLHPATGRKLAVMPYPLPADWQPSNTDHRYMREKCPELEATFDVEVRKFRRYFHRNAHRVSANWSDLFEEWLDRAVTNFRRVNPVPFASLDQATRAKGGATQSRPAARAAAGPDLDERLAEQDKRVLAELLKRQAAVGSGPVVDVRPPPRKNGAE